MRSRHSLVSSLKISCRCRFPALRNEGVSRLNCIAPLIETIIILSCRPVELRSPVLGSHVSREWSFVLLVECGGTLSAGQGEIQSYLFPNKYPNALTCTWTIFGGHQSAFTLTFTDFEVCSFFTLFLGDCCSLCGTPLILAPLVLPRERGLKLLILKKAKLDLINFKLKSIFYIEFSLQNWSFQSGLDMPDF